MKGNEPILWGELNRIIRIGRYCGFSYVHSGGLADPEFGIEVKFDQFEKPAFKPGAHVAPLMPLFYMGRQIPADFLHGASS